MKDLIKIGGIHPHKGYTCHRHPNQGNDGKRSGGLLPVASICFLRPESTQEDQGSQYPESPGPKAIGQSGDLPGGCNIVELIINQCTAIYRLVRIDTKDASKRRDDGKEKKRQRQKQYAGIIRCQGSIRPAEVEFFIG